MIQSPAPFNEVVQSSAYKKAYKKILWFLRLVEMLQINVTQIFSVPGIHFAQLIYAVHVYLEQ